MSDRSKKITELPLTNGISGGDLLLVVTNPTGNAVSKSITVTNLFGNASVNTVIRQSTPANSNIEVKSGTIFYDSNYVYIAVADNTLKRIQLEQF